VAERAKYLEYAAAVCDMAVAGTLTLRIGGTYPLAQAAAAHTALAGRQTTGKLVLVP
jgi:NADPH2:quinone reductase